METLFTGHELAPDQRALSRAAAEHYALTTAAAERGRRHGHPVPAVRRLRHAVAVLLMATARLIDATP